MTAAAQDSDERTASSSNFLTTLPKADASLTFSVSGEGRRYNPTWGLDQAWVNEQNLRKGVRHMGRENVKIGRTAFRMTNPLNDDGTLASSPLDMMRRRCAMFDIVDNTLPLVFTADQEAGTDPSYFSGSIANVNRWSAMIAAHVKWLGSNTKHPVAGVSPFNEPDYWEKEEGATASIQRNVAKTLKESYADLFANVNIVGGNTLNNDKAWTWFNTGKDYFDWGNTHQLAGSFANYADYYTKVTALGKVGYNDEMHNVGEAMIGLEYGMTVGIWWGFDSRARGEFCQFSSHGERLAYAEHRNNWTAASVYRHDDGRVKAFIGSSERQAYTTKYQFVSADRDVYFDGEGPLRAWQMEMPGGTGYQVGQTNAERVVDILWGPDVPAAAVSDGIYRIFNRSTSSVITNNGNNIVTNRYKNSTADNQQWSVHRCNPRIGGDFSFYDIELATNSQLRMNVLNFSTEDGANVMPWSQNATPSSNEQWYLEYAGDGYYYVRNRESALYLTAYGTSSSSAVNVTQRELLAEDIRQRQMWRFLPLGVDYETNAPAAPQGLTALPQSASVLLTWTANSESDLAAYHVLRAPAGTEDWNTIARGVTGNSYVDNSCRQGVAYIYKVKAVDHAHNQSEPSAAVSAQTTGDRSLVACWPMDDNLLDSTPNQMDAVHSASPTFAEGQQADSRALSLSGNGYVQLPYEVADADELTVAAWVRWSGGSAWQRLFDFGNGTDQYLFLSPSNGSNMRFAIKNGGDEQTLNAPRLETNSWKHVAVTIGTTRTAIYVDGEEVASTAAVTLRPSDLRPTLNYVGRSQFNSDPYFRGSIDDLQIYNYALSADEVRQVMEGSLSGIRDAQSAAEPSAPVYTLDGRQQSAPQRGVNIIGNRKLLVK